MLAHAVHPSGAGTLGSGKVVDSALNQLGISRDELAASCATGYGRKLLGCAPIRSLSLPATHGDRPPSLERWPPSSTSEAKMLRFFPSDQAARWRTLS